MQLQTLKTKEEKEEFLENDLIDRLIRIEQKVSAKFGKFINYRDTYCYKNLTPKNKERYEKFLKNKKKKKFAFASLFLVPFLGVLILQNNLTGRVIAEQIGQNILSSIQLFFIGLFLGILLTSFIFFFLNQKREKKLSQLFAPLEKLKKKNL